MSIYQDKSFFLQILLEACVSRVSWALIKNPWSVVYAAFEFFTYRIAATNPPVTQEDSGLETRRAKPGTGWWNKFYLIIGARYSYLFNILNLSSLTYVSRILLGSAGAHRASYKNTGTFYIRYISSRACALEEIGTRATKFLVTGIPTRSGSGFAHPSREFYRGLYKVTTKAFTTCNKNRPLSTQDNSFIEWLGGLIDGNGSFTLSKKGKSSCKITMDIIDEKVLQAVKHRYGGRIRHISGSNAVKYRLVHKKGLRKLLNDVNGFIRNPGRLLEFDKLCLKYDITVKLPPKLTFKNGWFSGILDSDGSIHYNKKSGSIAISITQKNMYLLNPLTVLYGGKIEILKDKRQGFKYEIFRKVELFRLIDDYFSSYPLKTIKNKRLNLIKEFFLVKDYKDSEDIHQYKWIEFLEKWEKSVH